MSFLTEKEGQIDFYNHFLPEIDSNLTLDDVIADNNDGVINGNILEFKQTVNNIEAVLLQCVKYLSSLRIKGKPVPAHIHIIDLTKGISYVYHSQRYLEHIEKVYVGSASKKDFISDFKAGDEDEVLRYKDNPSDEKRLIQLLKEKRYTKINIDENCIIGWAIRYYKEVKNATKEMFIGENGEIRYPTIFKDYIRPYTKDTNLEFKYLMDMLNADFQKADLGAFYTPKLYAEKSAELVMEAVKRVPEGNSYVIIDRCAGTGNLEASLPPQIQSHCILSTYEYYEYKVLLERLGDKVLNIIPPVKESSFDNGCVNGANALSESYVKDSRIMEYVNNPKCTIILYENPPYSDSTSVEHQKVKKGKESLWRDTYVVQEMKKKVKGNATKELANVFIWSGFEYYLRQDTDSYIVYSPAKYWKAHHLINKEFLGGYAFNRKHFHASSPSCVMCVLWGNKESDIDNFELEAFDIVKNQLISDGLLNIKKLSIPSFSEKYYDKRRKCEGDEEGGIVLNYKGTEDCSHVRVTATPIYSKNIIGWLMIKASGFMNHALNLSLLSGIKYDGSGFYLRSDNYLEKLPLFCAGRYVAYNQKWTEIDRIMKSCDGFEHFTEDVRNGILTQFLLKCLLVVCLDRHNRIRSLHGSDGRYYRNELCFDDTHGETLACKDIKNLEMGDKEQKLWNQWNEILKLAKQTENYDETLTYGVYQISEELDTHHKDDKNGKILYDYPKLHTALNKLRELLKEYYNTEIKDTLFEYEFLK